MCNDMISCRGDSLQERVGDYAIVHIDEEFDFDGVIFQISFMAFGRTYVVILNPDAGSFDPYYRLIVGGEVSLLSDRSYHFHGHLEGNPLHSAIMSRIQPGVYIGSIFIGNDSIHVEPATIHHLSTDERDMLVFRSSTFKESTISRMLSQDGLLVPLNVPFVTTLKDKEITVSRVRREMRATENEVRNRCPLKIVADYKFFSIVGKNNTALTTRYIVNMVARVNEIYTVVNWDDGEDETDLDRGRFVNMGFSIKELKILDKPSNQAGHYNSHDVVNNGVWNSNRLLEVG